MGSTWHPPPSLQIDQTASVIAAVWHHFKRGADPDVLLDEWPLVKGAATFLTSFRDSATGLPAPSFDLWEERLGIHLYSTAAVAHALERAARVAEEIGKDPRRLADGLARDRRRRACAVLGRVEGTIRPFALAPGRAGRCVHPPRAQARPPPLDRPAHAVRRRRDRAAAVEPERRWPGPLRGGRVLRAREPMDHLHALARGSPAAARRPAPVPRADRVGRVARHPDPPAARADRPGHGGTEERDTAHLVPLHVRGRHPQVRRVGDPRRGLRRVDGPRCRARSASRSDARRAEARWTAREAAGREGPASRRGPGRCRTASAPSPCRMTRPRPASL